MNYKVIAFYLGQIFKVFSLFLFLPVIVGLCYREWTQFWTFFVSMAVYIAVGYGLTIPFQKERKLRNKEALVVVGLAWIGISLIGALPFVIGGSIPHFLDALFETISGFTTTGATILTEPADMPKCMLFWRALTHWLGGMGILVFILAVMPGTDGSTFRLFKFESPGPQVGKIASKVRHTATILYVMYMAFTVVETIFLLAGGVDVFNAVTLAFSTAGTGGFANTSSSVAQFNSLYVEVVVMSFMFLFSLNFNIYYLVILRHFKVAFADEELHFYVTYVILAIITIALNLTLAGQYAFGTALRYSSFTVVSLSSSTGFATAEFNTWPQLSQTILVVCMFFGACAGSTGGGFKTSRILILAKAGYVHLLGVLRPQSVQVVRINQKRFTDEEVNGVIRYFLVYVMIMLIAGILLSFDTTMNGFGEVFSSTLSCLNNDGPFLRGAFAGYDGFNYFSKSIFMLLMLIGRLEIFPILLLFIPKTWSKRY